MDIGNALRRTGRDDITTRATIANIVQEIYPGSVKIQSIKMHGNTVIITTGNPLINSELQLLEGDIKKSAKDKLGQMGMSFSQNTQIRFR